LPVIISWRAAYGGRRRIERRPRTSLQNFFNIGNKFIIKSLIMRRVVFNSQRRQRATCSLRRELIF
jgi:hypothetical protein